MSINGGPMYKFTEAVSCSINCKDQQKIDYYWEKLLDNGGQEQMCGWLKDKYGLLCRIVPAQLDEWMSDMERAPRFGAALLKMDKLYIEILKNV